MVCCDDLTIESYGEIKECKYIHTFLMRRYYIYVSRKETFFILGHPYALGEYKKIGKCGGRSFFQHKNNTDIFLYYACSAWYIGLEVRPFWLFQQIVQMDSRQHAPDSTTSDRFNRINIDFNEPEMFLQRCQIWQPQTLHSSVANCKNLFLVPCPQLQTVSSKLLHFLKR